MQQITFATNMGKDTLAHSKLLLESLRRNLDGKEHQILVFVDSDNENALDYLLSIKSTFHDLTIIKNTLSVPIGYARNTTILTEYAKHEIISYLQSDMVIGPHYDTEVLQHTKPGRILSATRVEPPLHGASPVTITQNFGLTPEEFDFVKWNTFSDSVKRDELIEFFFAPVTYYKQDWLKLGGYDTTFRRSREDSDFVQRCLHAGIELVQTFAANVYHFTCVSSRGKDWFDTNNKEAQSKVELQKQADMIELRRFIRKWGTFSHGDRKLFKLDADLAIKNSTPHIVVQLEPFFSRVWLETEEQQNVLQQIYSQHHIIANRLSGFTDEDWNSYKHLYRTESLDNTFHVGEPTDYAVKITIDANKITNSNLFLANISSLYDLLCEYEMGDYELDGVSISIRTISVLPTPIVADNPPFDYNLLTVY